MNRLSPDHVKFELLLSERVAFVSAFNGIIVFFRNCTRNFFLTNLLQIVLYKSFETYLKVSLTSSLHYVVFKVLTPSFWAEHLILYAYVPRLSTVFLVFFKCFFQLFQTAGKPPKCSVSAHVYILFYTRALRARVRSRSFFFLMIFMVKLILN